MCERGLEFGGVLSGGDGNGGRDGVGDGDGDGGASTSDSDTTISNDGGWTAAAAAVGAHGDGDGVVVLPLDDDQTVGPLDSIAARGVGEPGCCYHYGIISDSYLYPLPTAEVVSAVGLLAEEETLPHADVFVVPTSTAAAAAAAAGAGAARFAPLRALPIGEDALPPEARPPWELAAAFKLVACERVLPSPRRAAAATPLRPSPTPSRKRRGKAAPPGGRRRGAASSCAERGKASSVQWRGVSNALEQGGGWGARGW